MGWISPWALFFGGIQSEIHNMKVRLLSPFRGIMKEKYGKKYNDPQLFAKFSEMNSDISLFSKPYHLSGYGSGLFISELFEAYKKNGVKVKIISMGQKHGLADYFVSKRGLSAVKIDRNDTEDDILRLIASFQEDDFDVLSLDHTVISSACKIKSDEFLHDIFQRLSEFPNSSDTFFLVPSLFVDKNELQAIKAAKNNLNLRFIHLNPDSSGSISKMEEDHLNIVFPFDLHEKGFNSRKHDLQSIQEKLADIPSWILLKDYVHYHHFTYQHKDKSGFYFMDSDWEK